MSCDTLAHQPH